MKSIESNEIIWAKIKLQLKDIYGEAEYSNWLKLLTFSKVDKDIIVFYAPTKFMCDWILSHYGKKFFFCGEIRKNQSKIYLFLLVFPLSYPGHTYEIHQ